MDHLRSGVRDQPGQHGETLSLPKKEKEKKKNCDSHGQSGCDSWSFLSIDLAPVNHMEKTLERLYQQEAKYGRSHLYSQYFGSPRWEHSLSPGV